LRDVAVPARPLVFLPEDRWLFVRGLAFTRLRRLLRPESVLGCPPEFFLCSPRARPFAVGRRLLPVTFASLLRSPRAMTFLLNHTPTMPCSAEEVRLGAILHGAPSRHHSRCNTAAPVAVLLHMPNRRQNGEPNKPSNVMPSASASMQMKSKELREREQLDFRASFGRLATAIAGFAGSPWMFLLALVIVLVWGLLGPMYHYSNTWQLVINTGTTIITFLMVFLIQNTQNRDARAIHLKLDEIIRSIRKAHNEMIDIEKLSDKELEELATHYEHIRAECERRDSRRHADKDAGADNIDSAA
jgi:low affinity Fe/Cu permease